MLDRSNRQNTTEISFADIYWNQILIKILCDLSFDKIIESQVDQLLIDVLKKNESDFGIKFKNSFKQYYDKLEVIKRLPNNPKINDLSKIRNLVIVLNYDTKDYSKLKKITLFSESNFVNGFDQIIKSKFDEFLIFSFTDEDINFMKEFIEDPFPQRQEAKLTEVRKIGVKEIFVNDKKYTIPINSAIPKTESNKTLDTQSSFSSRSISKKREVPLFKFNPKLFYQTVQLTNQNRRSISQIIENNDVFLAKNLSAFKIDLDHDDSTLEALSNSTIDMQNIFLSNVEFLNFRKQENENSLLSSLILLKKKDLIVKLLEKQPSLFASKYSDQIPLHHAIISNDFEIFNKIIEEMRNSNITIKEMQYSSMTIKEIFSINLGKPNSIHYYFSYSTNKEILKFIVDNADFEDFFKKKDALNSPLEFLILSKNTEAFKIFLDKFKNELEMSSLKEIFEFSIKENKFEMIKILKSFNQSIIDQLDIEQLSKNLLQKILKEKIEEEKKLAKEDEAIETIRDLHENFNINFNSIKIEETSILDYAIENNLYRIVATLIQLGAKINTKYFSKTPTQKILETFDCIGKIPSISCETKEVVRYFKKRENLTESFRISCDLMNGR